MTIAIVDYGSGNLHSVQKAMQHAAESINVDAILTSDPKQVLASSHIVLPGVGAFGDCVAGLHRINGMRDALEEVVHTQKRPFLGICVGMQMMLQTGHEHGKHKGLGWMEGDVVALQKSQITNQLSEDENSESRIPNPEPSLKIPHMGWNTLSLTRPDHPIFDGLSLNPYVYFVHSYQAECQNTDDVIATTEYGQTVTACIAHENMVGTQFHPEKSHDVGLHMLTNFVTHL